MELDLHLESAYNGHAHSWLVQLILCAVIATWSGNVDNHSNGFKTQTFVIVVYPSNPNNVTFIFERKKAYLRKEVLICLDVHTISPLLVLFNSVEKKHRRLTRMFF